MIACAGRERNSGWTLFRCKARSAGARPSSRSAHPGASRRIFAERTAAASDANRPRRPPQRGQRVARESREAFTAKAMAMGGATRWSATARTTTPNPSPKKLSSSIPSFEFSAQGIRATILPGADITCCILRRVSICAGFVLHLDVNQRHDGLQILNKGMGSQMRRGNSRSRYRPAFRLHLLPRTARHSNRCYSLERDANQSKAVYRHLIFLDVYRLF
jgi:hypothetical protein